MATPTQSNNAPEEPSALQKDASTIGRSMLGGALRGLWSGAWQFGVAGLAVGLLMAFPFGAGVILPWCLGSALFGAVATTVVNLAKGLGNGVKENVYRGQMERAARGPEPAQGQSQQQSQSQEKAKAPAREADSNQSYSVSPGANGVAATTAADNVSTPAAAPDAATASMAAPVAASAPKGSVSYGQSPSRGGSWEELVRRNTAAGLPAQSR